MRILVCGGRAYGDRLNVRKVLDSFVKDRGLSLNNVTIVQGGAYGADYLAAEWAKANQVSCITEPAHWNRTANRSAGIDRNQRMLDKWSPEVCIAFPGHTGTADMVKRASEAGIEVIKIMENNVS